MESEPGRGSSFTIYLPRTVAPPVSGAPRLGRNTPPIGKETILLVEDESGVRSFARTVLVRYGYHVLEAESSEQALTQLSAYDGPLDLLLTDVMLSGMDGGQLARHLAPGRPNLRVIFMSGYADPSVEEALPDGCDLMEKPFTAHTLLSRVRESLGSRVVIRAS